MTAAQRETLTCILAGLLMVVATSVRLLPDPHATVCGSDEDCMQACLLKGERNCNDMMFGTDDQEPEHRLVRI